VPKRDWSRCECGDVRRSTGRRSALRERSLYASRDLRGWDLPGSRSSLFVQVSTILFTPTPIGDGGRNPSRRSEFRIGVPSPESEGQLVQVDGNCFPRFTAVGNAATPGMVTVRVWPIRSVSVTVAPALTVQNPLF
jgi:hypothetical protein